MLKIIILLSCFISSYCLAQYTPANQLQVQYQKSENSNTFAIDLSSIYQIPQITYHYLDNVFTSFYQTISLSTSVTDSTFNKSSHYELIALPLIAANSQGVHFELFGNFSDPDTQYLTNLSSDQALYDHMENTSQFNMYDSELSVGAGLSFKTGKSSKIKIILSDGHMPGYGNSKALLGFETKF